MKARFVAALSLGTLLTGCSGRKPATTADSFPRDLSPIFSTTSTMSYRRGKDFDTTKVKDIQKGKTTTQEIIQWLGQLYGKKVITPIHIRWDYMWRESVVTTDRTTKTTKEVGNQKTLELLISNDVVMNYVLSEGPFEADGKVNFK